MKVVYRPRSVILTDEYGAQSSTADTVFEPADNRPQPTGLFDQHGVMLYRTVECDPIGFRVR